MTVFRSAGPEHLKGVFVQRANKQTGAKFVLAPANTSLELRKRTIYQPRFLLSRRVNPPNRRKPNAPKAIDEGSGTTFTSYVFVRVEMCALPLPMCTRSSIVIGPDVTGFNATDDTLVKLPPGGTVVQPLVHFADAEPVPLMGRLEPRPVIVPGRAI